MSGKLMKSKGE